MRQFATVIRFLAILATGLLMMPLAMVLAANDPLFATGSFWRAITPLTLEERAVALLVIAVPYGLVAGALLRVACFCGLVNDGQLISREAHEYLMQVGVLLTVGVALLIPARLAIVLLLSAAASVPVVNAAIATAVAVGVMLGFMIMLFARILAQSVACHEENASFI